MSEQVMNATFTGCWWCKQPYTPNPDHPHYCENCVLVCQSCLTLKVIGVFGLNSRNERSPYCMPCEVRLRAEGKLPKQAGVTSAPTPPALSPAQVDSLRDLLMGRKE